MLLQSQSGCWSTHCGIVSLNKNVIVHPVLSSIDQRFLLVSVEHVNSLFDTFHILTIYAPSNAPDRRTFFSSIASLIPIKSLIESPTSRLVITGDFNYSCSHPTRAYLGAHPAWRSLLEQNMINCMTSPLDSRPTFRRGSQSSNIDYIFASHSLHSQSSDPSIDFIEQSWTDHALLSISLKMCSSTQGPGLWRMNPNLFKNHAFVDRLTKQLERFASSLPASFTDPQVYWELLKTSVQQTAKSFGRRHVQWRAQQLRLLQRKRNRILREHRNHGMLPLLLETIERQIGALQQEVTANNILRAGRHWRENGETSAGYLKKTISTRASSRYIPSLKATPESEATSNPSEMQNIAKEFYKNLYTCDPVSLSHTEALLNHIPEQNRLAPQMADLLTAPFILDDILQASTRSPHSSSPGSDGLPYEALSFLFRFEPLQSLVLDVYNQALESAIFPASWTITSTVLIPKKGNLNLLSNWRPISLINTDAKIFTRLLTGRMRLSCSKIIHRVQKGFMPGRFIGDNGLLMQLVKTEAEQRQSTEVGLLLDQEKAYDRVNPEYLKQVLLKFGFPSTLVQIIDKLFFETQIQINVNGFFTSSFQQSRGLRQGDPLSPLLFNIAFDPFLRSIESDNELQGFQFRQAANPADLHIVPPPPIKILAYADDVAVFLSKPSDFVRLRQLYKVYAQASNAKLNLGKTEAFSLSGHPHPPWQTFLQENQISSWHDKNSPSALRYLGFAVCSSRTQRDGFISALWLKIQHECNIHSQRALSFRGRVTVMNTLIYSKLWHVLRLLSVPKAALQRFSSLAYQFVIQKAFPKFKYDLLLTDRQCGGLKLLDPNKQQLVLQWKWLCPLLLSHQSDSVSLGVQYLSYSLQHHFHAVDPLLPLLFPHCRKGPLGQNNNLNVFTNFFRTMDSFQRSYQDVNLSPASCLELPLASIYTFMAPHSTEPQPPSELDPAFARLSVPHWPKIQVSEAYSFDGRFHRKQRRDLHISRIHITRFFKCLDEHKIRLEQFFLSHCSPTLPSSSLSTLGTVDFSPILNGLLPPDLFSSTFRTTDLRKALSPCVPSPIFDPPISAKQWSRFWKGDVPLKSRDVWYRIIFNKLSCRQNLHRLLPTSFTDPLCPLCSSAVEDPLHFVLTCHYKHPLWEYIWDVYFDQPFSQRAVKLAIFSLQLPKTNYAHRSHSPFQLIACAILSLWSAHWAFVFSETPFDFSTVLANVFKHLSKLQSEVD